MLMLYSNYFRVGFGGGFDFDGDPLCRKCSHLAHLAIRNPSV
jgi:hypothetical protein